MLPSSTRRRILYEYRYLSPSLLADAYQAATGAPPPVPGERRPWSWPDGKSWGVTIQRRPLTRHGLAQLTERHLSRDWKTLPAAGPGDFLHVTSASLTLRAIRAPSLGGTAVWLHGRANDPDIGLTLLALTGPIEDCPDWAGSNGTRLPVPASTTVLIRLLQAMAQGLDLPAGDAETISSPDQAITLARRLTGAPAPPPWESEEVLARVLVRQPGPSPFTTAIIGMPLWVRRSIPAVR